MINLPSPPFYVHHNSADNPQKWVFEGPFITYGKAESFIERLVFNQWGEIDYKIVSLTEKKELEREMTDIIYIDDYPAQKEAEKETAMSGSMLGFGTTLGDLPEIDGLTYAQIKALTITPEQAKEMLQLEISGKDRWQFKQYLRKVAKGKK